MRADDDCFQYHFSKTCGQHFRNLHRLRPSVNQIKVIFTDPASVGGLSDTSPDAPRVLSSPLFFCPKSVNISRRRAKFSKERACPLGKMLFFLLQRFTSGIWFDLCECSPPPKNDVLSPLKLKPREPTGVFFWQVEVSGNASIESHQT